LTEIFDCYKIINGDKMKIETARLYLRELTHEDFDALYKVLADSDIMQHYPYTFDEIRVQNWINGSI
jgi:RimJ/RimL family protein N-acetyltransferase